MSKNKGSTEMVKANVFQVNLATNQMPEYSIDRSKGIVKRGKTNTDPNYLLWLYNNHAEHGQIVRGKARYVSGLLIKPKEPNPLVEAFLDRANPFETWHELEQKTDIDDALQGGHFLKIETNLAGQPINWYHIPYATVCVSSDLESYQVCDDWKNSWNHEKETYPKYKPGHVGTSIYYHKPYVPAENKIKAAYAQPEYRSCTLDIDTDIRIGTFFNNYVRNNFSSGTLIIIPNGETDPKKKEAIVKDLTAEHAGEDNAGKVVVAFTPKDGNKDVQVLSLNSNDLDKQYAEVSKRDKEKIVAGHGVTGVLFKIKTDDKALFSRSEIVEAHELFINEYAKVKQIEKNNRRSKWLKAKTGIVAEFEIEQIDPIGLELPLDNQNVISALNAKYPGLVNDYIVKKYGLKVPQSLDVNGQPIVTPVLEETQVNEHLKNLTGRQMQGLMRIVKKYDDKKISKETALALMKSGFGIDSTMGETFLIVADEDTPDLKMAVKQSAQDKNKKLKELFLKYSHDIEEGEVLEVIDFKKLNLATALEGSINDLRSGVLNALKGNPYLTIDEIAKQFGVEVTDIQRQLDWLIEKQLIEGSEGQYQPTAKALKKESKPFETEIITEYTYQLRPELKAQGQPALLATSRQDCFDWYNMTRKKAITYEAIQKLTNEFGDSAFDFRGGFWNNNGEVENTCRHYWEGQTKLVRKK